MVVKVSKRASKEKIQKELNKLSRNKSKKGFNAKRYFGKLVRGLDGLSYQKELRDEWG